MKRGYLAAMTVAIFSLFVLSAQAQAAAHFHSEKLSTYIAGSGTTNNEIEFSPGSGKLSCSSTSLTGTNVFAFGSGTTNETSLISLSPAYSGCKAFGQASTVVVNGCEYRFEATTTTAGKMDIVCSGTNKIQILVGNVKTPICEITIAAQTGLSAVAYQNQGTPSVILVALKLSGLSDTIIGGGGVCGTPGTHSNGAMTGMVLLKGFETSAMTKQVGIKTAP